MDEPNAWIQIGTLLCAAVAAATGTALVVQFERARRSDRPRLSVKTRFLTGGYGLEVKVANAGQRILHVQRIGVILRGRDGKEGWAWTETSPSAQDKPLVKLNESEAHAVTFSVSALVKASREKGLKDTEVRCVRIARAMDEPLDIEIGRGDKRLLNEALRIALGQPKKRSRLTWRRSKPVAKSPAVIAKPGSPAAKVVVKPGAPASKTIVKP